jgi:hypothetical protein
MRILLFRLLNVVVTVLSLYYTIIVAAYIYASLDSSKAIGIVGKPGFVEILTFLILFGSTVYYHISRRPRMRLISSIGCISMIAVLLIILL